MQRKLLLLVLAGTALAIGGCSGNDVGDATNDETGGDRQGQETEGQSPVAFTTELTGGAEIPGPGAPEGTGSALVQLDPTVPRLCYEIKVDGIAEATAAHLHRGREDAAGPIVVTFQTPSGGSSVGCLDQPELEDLFSDLAASAQDFYVNIHNGNFPDGAVRGQLRPQPNVHSSARS